MGTDMIVVSTAVDRILELEDELRRYAIAYQQQQDGEEPEAHEE